MRRHGRFLKSKRNFIFGNLGKKRKENSFKPLDAYVESSRRPIFGGSSHGNFDDSPNDQIPPFRLYVLNFAVILTGVIFLGALFNLTVIHGQENRDLAENNRIRLVKVEAQRGKIFDRFGKVIADSHTVYTLKKGDDSTKIAENQVKDLEQKGLAGENYEGELGQIFRGVEREYPAGQSLSHVLGYVSQNTPDEQVAKSGIEASWGQFLKGIDGKKLVEVDADEKKISILANENPVAGRDVHLTVDSDLQQISFNALSKQAEKVNSKKGAVIVTDVNSGEILALVSVPSFDPKDVSKYLSDEDKPFFNRAIQGAYPPGSVFKIVSALAGLESGVIDKDTQIEDVGEFQIANDRFVNWYFLQYGRRDGILKIDRAIARSNDVFFYKLAEEMGLTNLREMAVKFGFGARTGVDIADEDYGLVPSREWKESTFSTDWFLGDTLHLSIGQGFMLVTPIQVNKMTAYIASGKVTKPHLVSKIDGKNGQGEVKVDSQVLAEGIVKRDNLDVVRSGMKQACETGGTGWPFFEAKYKIGCKTGTAEKSLGNPHAWFTAFAPFDSSKIAVTVLVEDGGEGSSIAGPVAKEILDWWMGNRNR